MPLVRISLRRGKAPDYLAALRDAVYQAMTDSFAVPLKDRFILVHQHDEEEFDYDPNYLDIQRTDDLVIIQIVCNNTRTVEQKKVFYARLCGLLGERPGVRPEDVFINIVETAKENWSFGHGIGQYI
jgi:phenylpyruvate tautomerase PptA (4-oxalocrotonate tautomerase family)